MALEPADDARFDGEREVLELASAGCADLFESDGGAAIIPTEHAIGDDDVVVHVEI